MTGSRPFEPLERSTISERLRDDLLQRIAAGELAPGEAMPAERVLAERLGVARTSVREAIQGLVALGVVERRGNRSFVTEQVPGTRLPAADAGKRSLRAMVEAWRILELCLVELAAARATARERVAVRKVANAPVAESADAFLAADREFHAGLGTACGNPVLAEVHTRVVDTLWGTEGIAAVLVGVGPGRSLRAAVAEAGAEHRAIAEAFVAGDSAKMLEAVDRHLGHVQERISRLSRRLAPPDGHPGSAAGRTVGL